jgi:hypothetical protein
MLPDPLHPAVVHIPVALAALIPFLALLAGLVIHRGLLPARSWALIVVLQALLVGSAWFALETGEHEEDRVEQVLAERYIEEHEEAAERFMVFASLGLLIVGAGLLSGPAGGPVRVAGVAGTLAVLAAGVAVGHSGGELVYTHGAANAYIDGGGSVAEGALAARSGSHEEEEDEEEHHD